MHVRLIFDPIPSLFIPYRQLSHGVSLDVFKYVHNKAHTPQATLMRVFVSLYHLAKCNHNSYDIPGAAW